MTHSYNAVQAMALLAGACGVLTAAVGLGCLLAIHYCKEIEDAMTKNDELKRPEVLIHKSIRDFHQPIRYFAEADASAYMDRIEAENQRMRELLRVSSVALRDIRDHQLFAKHIESFLADHP